MPISIEITPMYIKLSANRAFTISTQNACISLQRMIMWQLHISYLFRSSFRRRWVYCSRKQIFCCILCPLKNIHVHANNNCYTEEIHDPWTSNKWWETRKKDSLHCIQCILLFIYEGLGLMGERVEESERCRWREIKWGVGALGENSERISTSSLVAISISHRAKHTHAAPYYDLSLSPRHTHYLSLICSQSLCFLSALRQRA